MGKKVFLIGDINIDFTLKGIKKIPNFSKDLGTEIELEDALYTIGGSGFNFIKAISSFGVQVDFYAKIGNDFYGKYIKDYLEDKGINNSLIVSDKVKTGITTIIPIKSDRIFFTFNGGNEKLCIDDLELEKIKDFDHVHFSSYYLLKDLQPHILSVLKYLKSNNITTSFDTGFDPDENWQRDNILSMLKYVDIFIPSRIEALNIANKKCVEDALNLFSNYCPIVIIKLGSKGLIGKKRNKIKKDEVIYMSSYDIDIVDTSCCGDCFDAGFIYSYLHNYKFEEGLGYANACGNLQATKLGSYKFGGVGEIKDFINKNCLIRNRW